MRRNQLKNCGVSLVCLPSNDPDENSKNDDPDDCQDELLLPV
jgi:hypothetical protein